MTAQETLHISGLSPIDNAEHRILQEAYKRLEIEIIFHGLPGRRSLRASNDGTFDGEAARIYGIEKRYPNLIRIPVPVRIVEQFAYALKPIQTIQGWDDMKGLKIGFRRGILMNENQTKGLAVVLVSDFRELFIMLARGAIDTAVLEEKNRNAYGPADLYRSPNAIETTSLYHYVHKSHANLIGPLTEALRDMKDSGRLDILLKPEIPPSNRQATPEMY